MVGSTSFGSEVVLTGVGSDHVTLPPSEAEYFRTQLHYIKPCFRFHQYNKRFPSILKLKKNYTIFKVQLAVTVDV